MAYQEGDTSPPHINVHNEVVSKLAEISAEYDLDLVLPPQRNIGDTEHVKDHNLITDALQAIDDWEAAGGGATGAAVIGDATGAVTKSSFTGDGTNGDLGQAYDVYQWLGSGQLVVDEPGLAEILLCAGGGGGGTQDAGGGGAGGRLETAITFSKGTETVTVGAGGTATTFPNPGNNGQLSSLSFVSVVGGGKGGTDTPTGAPGATAGDAGGSGGGGAGSAASFGIGGTGTPGQGNDGGKGFARTADNESGGGGGGAMTAGTDGTGTKAGDGGTGRTTFITGQEQQHAGGGAGGAWGTGGSGGTGGGGDGGSTATPDGSPGEVNTGGGGGGAGGNRGDASGGQGGSGIVIVRVKVPSMTYPFRSETTAPRTAHAARIEDGIVRQVIVIPHLDDDDAKITEYCNRIGLPGTWVDTSYTGSRRGKYAGVGDTFVSTKAGGEFISPVTEEISTTDLPGDEQ